MLEVGRERSRIRPEEESKESNDEARTTIKDVIFSLGGPTSEIDISEAYSVSKEFLPDYVTLDWKHRTDIDNIIDTIRKYAEDRTRKRPLNIMMQAEPGSGKSHLVKCLTHSYPLKRCRASAIDFNMTSLQSFEDLIQPLDAVRNLKVLDKFPILFLDEFDSQKDIYAKLLPLMWDGEFNISHRDIKLGKLVIILAGSGKHLAAAMKSAKDMQFSSIPEESKLVDLISRINGGELEIPPLDLLEGDRNRIVDKVCITISLLQDRFSQQIELIPWALLRFVAMTRFRYGVRSISNLIDLVSPGKEKVEDYQINIDHLQLPLNSVSKLKGSSLAYHIWSEDGPAEIVARWNECTKCSTSIRVNPPF